MTPAVRDARWFAQMAAWAESKGLQATAITYDFKVLGALVAKFELACDLAKLRRNAQ